MLAEAFEVRSQAEIHHLKTVHVVKVMKSLASISKKHEAPSI